MKLLTAFLLLAGCGGSGGGSDGGGGIDPRLARLDIYEAQKLRVLGDPGVGVIGMAPTETMPDTGSAIFSGSATIRVENPGAALVLFGDTAVTISFDDAMVTGTMDNFFGTTSGGDVVNFGGTVTVDSGTLNPELTLDYAGALSASGEDVVIAGVMQGVFLGDPVGAISAADLEADVIYNDTPVDGTVIVIGETTGVTTP